MKKASRDRMPRSRINSTKKSRKQPSRRELITKPADDVQHLLAPEQVKVATARGLSLNDFGFQRSVSEGCVSILTDYIGAIEYDTVPGTQQVVQKFDAPGLVVQQDSDVAKRNVLES